ncbi:MAG TPA: hypothetical protein VD998_00715, partial [Verrucomicrobiae bacterium]|nr:hypothetical protein [Verrucomicrobiae bacterium]
FRVVHGFWNRSGLAVGLTSYKGCEPKRGILVCLTALNKKKQDAGLKNRSGTSCVRNAWK